MTDPPLSQSLLDGKSPPPSPLTGWVVLFLGFSALYGFTANRGVQWQDSGFHLFRMLTGELHNPLGLALSHPLHHWLGRFAIACSPIEPPLAATLISALAGAVAVANVYGCVVTISRSRTAGALAAISLGVANLFWHLATIVETYTLAAALLSAEVWCLAVFARTRKAGPLAGMAFFNGLGIANHMLASLTTPVLAAVALWSLHQRQVRFRHIAIVVVAWVMGSLPYTGLIVAEFIHTGQLGETVRSALFGKSFADEVLNVRTSFRQVGMVVAFSVLSFPSLFLPAAVCGIGRSQRIGVAPLLQRALPIALFLHLVFVVRYNVVDQQTFLAPAFVLLAILAGIGSAVVLQVCRRRTKVWLLAIGIGFLVVTPVVSALTPGIARRADVLGAVARNKPYRDDYVYLFTPWSVVERSAERMSSEALALAGERGLILVEDRMAASPIRCRALLAERDQIVITTNLEPDQINRAVQDGCPVVLVPKNVDAPETAPPVGRWQRVGDLYTLTND